MSEQMLYRLAKPLAGRDTIRPDKDTVPFGPADDVEDRLDHARRKLRNAVDDIEAVGDPVTHVSVTGAGPDEMMDVAQELRDLAPLAWYDPDSRSWMDPLDPSSWPDDLELD